ncbi:MAG: hypothetical protein ACU85E_16320 [Gammaproteobacteria bacterium]
MNQDNKTISGEIDGEKVVARAYRQLQQAEPSSDIDKAILDAARAEAGPRKKGAMLNPFSGHWFVPASLAAVLVLTVGIVLTLEKETGTELYEADQYRPQETETKPKVTPAPAARTQAISRERSEMRQKAAPEVGARLPLVETQGVAKPIEVPKEKKTMDVKSAPMMMQQPAPAESKPKPAATEDLSSQPPVEELLREAAPVPVGPAPKTDAVSAPADAEPTLRKLEPESGAVGGTVQESVPVRDAEAWIKEIRELIQQDKANEARQQLNEFVRAYPDYPLDEELSALAQ